MKQTFILFFGGGISKSISLEAQESATIIQRKYTRESPVSEKRTTKPKIQINVDIICRYPCVNFRLRI